MRRGEPGGASRKGQKRIPPDDIAGATTDAPTGSDTDRGAPPPSPSSRAAGSPAAIPEDTAPAASPDSGAAKRRPGRFSARMVSYHGRDEQTLDRMSLSGGAAAPKMLQSVRRRLINSKRGDMPVALRKLYSGGAGGGYAKGAASAVFISHTRFATASLPAVRETHPHEWTPFRQDKAWVFLDGRFRLGACRKAAGARIYHPPCPSLMRWAVLQSSRT